MTRVIKVFFLLLFLLCSSWGFFAHRKINELAIYTLPPKMSVFYKKNLDYLIESAVNPDRRRYAVAEEAPRHYIDLDVYGDSAVYKLPRYWQQAVTQIGQDSLMKHGIVPWHIYFSYNQLKEAFLLKDPDRILRISAELGHYIADAHVPLHTTQNYDGQLTNQVGIHGLWESRLPELFFNDYDFFVGKSEYISNVQLAAWEILVRSHQAVDSVLKFEKDLSVMYANNKFNFETKGKQTVKVFSEEFSRKYHEKLNGMVERQFRASVRMTGSVWFSAWVDAGQPDLKELLNYKPSEEELEKRRQEIVIWKQRNVTARDHESNEN